MRYGFRNNNSHGKTITKNNRKSLSLVCSISNIESTITPMVVLNYKNDILNLKTNNLLVHLLLSVSPSKSSFISSFNKVSISSK